ncbi:MAG: M1 family metallopeptidase [Deltaproteobacteria bacterium]|nr:M1 family metallopeptidase [Deltaproteobacteria bacterium]
MRRISLAVVSGLAALLPACFAPVAPPPDAAGEDEIRFRGASVDPTLPDVDAQGYELDIRVDDAVGREAFSADMKGTYVATRSLDELTLDFEGNTIDDVLVSGRPATHRREGSKLVIKLPTTVANGKTFTTRVRYHGNVLQADGANPNDFAAFGGLNVKQRNAERKRIFSSLNWPSKARKWLPTRDHPADGAMFAINATFPKAFTVLANGKQASVVENADGTKTWRYEALTPMPVYDFHVSAYESWKVDEARSSGGVPITTYTYGSAHARQASIYGDVPKTMDFYEKSFGKYRWGSVAYIEEPIFGGGMEHAGVISMDETLFPDPKTARATAFHELAHHWSGNLARIRTWNDFWLSEGFTEYLTARFIAANDGPAAKKTVYREYLTQALEADRTTPHALRPRDPEIDVLKIFDAISYQKGALTLRAIERVVGEKELTDFLKGWFDRHAFQAVSTAELEKELKEKTGKDLAKFFEGFVYTEGHPEIRVTFQPAGAETELKVEQLQTKGPPGGYVFPLDVDLVDESGRAERVTVDLTGKTTTKRVRTARPTASVVVDADEYLVGTVACGQSNDNAPCKEGFRCEGGSRGASSVCVPK